MARSGNNFNNLLTNQRIDKNKQTETYITMLAANFPKQGLMFSIHRKMLYNKATIIPGSVFTDPVLAARIVQWWAKKGYDTYFAMGGQKEVNKKEVQEGNKPRKYPLALRKKSNVGMCSAIYVDIDVKENAYTTQQDALIALYAFCKKYKLPVPSMIVSSGTGGVHVFWVADELFTPAEHNALSFNLIVNAQEFGLFFDPECTKDVCRLLRPPGTWNFKTDPASPVELLAITGRIPLATLRKCLKVTTTPRLLNKPISIVTPAEPSPNDDLLQPKRVYPLAEFEEVRKYCGFLDTTHKTGGREHKGPIWHQTVLLASYCENGLKLAHELSQGHGAYGDGGEVDSEYDKVETAKRESSTLGPTKCASLRQEGVKECETCVHFVLNTSPINVPSFVRQPSPATPGVNRDIIKLMPNILDEQESQDERAKRMVAERRPKRDMLYLASNNPDFPKPTIANIITIDPSNPKNELHPSNMTILQQLPGTNIYTLTYNNLLHSGYILVYDEFANKLFINGKPFQEDTISMLRHYCITESKGASVPSLKVVTEATFRLGYDNRINPLKDYLLNELKWDGIERAKQWTIIACGAEDTELTHEMSEKFLIGLVKRPLEPGCKFDTVLVFEGPEGLGKSTTFAILAGLDHPERFFDSPIIHEPALDRQALMQGRWVIEIAELADIKRGDMKKVNGFLSRLADPARVLYTNLSIDRPRTCVFAGTTTDSEYLRNDQNRRFWCLKIKRIQLDWLTNNREQLLAEAVHKYKNGESTVLPERLWGAARIMQKQRRIRDDWEEVLEDILTWPNVTKIADPAKWPDPAPTIPVIKEIYNNQRKVLFVSSSLLLTKALKITPDRMRGGASHRLAAAMRELGWIREQVFGEGRGYIKALPGDKPLTDELENEETHDDETIKAAGGGAVNSESNEGENEDTGYDEIEADDEAGDNEETESDNENIEEEEGNEP